MQEIQRQVYYIMHGMKAKNRNGPIRKQEHHRFFWARAMGWYSDALVDALDYFPVAHPKRKALIDILNRLVNAIEKQPG
jgi:rhamnogalacturonyl hydrolase YesR